MQENHLRLPIEAFYSLALKLDAGSYQFRGNNFI
jgi:hypothetical protein